MTDIQTKRTRRTLSVLFLDVAGYSKINNEREYGLFFDLVLSKIAEITNEYNPIYINSWGDGVVCVFETPEPAAKCALDLRDLFRNEDWHKYGLNTDLKARIGLHAGSVWIGEDPIQKRIGVTGSNINLAARIEPATTPNEVWASHAFITLLEYEKPNKIKWWDLGNRDLAKQWGSEHLYLLGRPQDSSDHLIPDTELPELEALKEILAKSGEIGTNVLEKIIKPVMEAMLSRDLFEDLRVHICVEPLLKTPTNSSWVEECFKFVINCDVQTYLKRPQLDFMAYISGQDGINFPTTPNPIDYPHRVYLPNLPNPTLKQFRELFKVNNLTIWCDGKKVEFEEPKDSLNRKYKYYLLSYKIKDKNLVDTLVGKRVRFRYKIETIINKYPGRVFYGFDKLTRKCYLSFYIHDEVKRFRSTSELTTMASNKEPYFLTSRAIEYYLDGTTFSGSLIRFEWEINDRRDKRIMSSGGAARIRPKKAAKSVVAKSVVAKSVVAKSVVAKKKVAKKK